MAMKYQHSTNQKASRAQAQSDQLPPIAPRLPRSQSANDAASHVYGSSQYAYNNRDAQYYYNNPPTHGPPSHTVDPYGYHDAYGYHQYAAEQAPNDETAAYHQYHAQQAAMKHAQHQRSQHALPPIYDNAPYNPGYYNTQQQQTNIHRQQQQQQQQRQQQQQQPPPPQQHHYDRNLYAPYNIKDNKKKDKKDKETIESKDSDALPSGPTKLRHAATTGGYFNKHSSGVVDIITSGRNLRYELEEIQNRKNLKTKELFDKRKKLSAKSSEKSHATRQLEDTKKKWNIEREEIIKSYGGKIPQFIIESDKLRKDLENLSNRNSALQASLEVVSAHLQNELYQLQYQLKIENEISQQTHEHNIELERRVRELRIEKLELETELKTEQDKEIAIEKNIYNDKQYYKNDNNKFKKEYPPESTVIENLLQAQVEFYFSDYNLKRDKRLLSDVTKPPKKGFLKLLNVMKLSRIRQLCSEIETLEEALRRSNILTLIREDIKQEEIIKIKDEIKDEKKNEKEQRKYEIWVGRLNFEKPREKEFPFRRTVFIFGIPIDGSKEFLEIMLKPFGNVSKIQFDHSPDGIDRKIGIKFLNKPRVYTLYYYDNTNIIDNSPGPNRREMIFKTSYDIGSGGGSGTKDVKKEVITMIKCHKCGKDKSVSEGFYTTSQWSVIYCAQCAAQLAEDQLNIYYKERNITQFQHYPRHKWLGIPPSDISNRKTALVVFASQRQASKCAYVRTRIAYNGAFATHFHHYSKVKKEIVLSESNENNKDIKDIKDKENVNKNNINQKKMGKNDNKNKYKQKDNKSQQQRRRQNNNNRKKGRGQRNNDRNIRGQRQYTQYVNYAQQQAAYYAGQQPPPQQQQQHMPNMKQPKIYRQSSAPTGR